MSIVAHPLCRFAFALLLPKGLPVLRPASIAPQTDGRRRALP
jgi:hypothetical protein